MFTGASNMAEGVDKALIFIFSVAFIFIIGITAFMIYTLIRFSRNKGKKAMQFEDSVKLEIIWITIPVILVMIMFYYGWKGYLPMKRVPADALQITAIGRMWEWEFDYGNGMKSKQLVIPVNKPVRIGLKSEDVNHSLFIPAFRVKQDVIPGYDNYLWFIPTIIGDYEILCTEYCGLLHSMDRTKLRPLPLKLLSLNASFRIFLVLFLAGTILLLTTGIIPLVLGLINVFLYNYLYTKLKKITILAIIPGALVGAIPPLIGYASAGGIIPDHDIIVFSLFMFFWQIPHFWLILIKHGKDYASAGFPSLLNYLDERKILYLIFFWVVITSVFLSISGIEIFNGNIKYPLVVLNVLFIFLFYRFLFIRQRQQNAFLLINSFSFLLMCFLIAGSILGMK